MGAAMNILSYIVWVQKGDSMRPDGYYIGRGKRNENESVNDPEEARQFERREEAEGFILIDSGKNPDLIGQYEIRAICVGYAIRYKKTRSEEVVQYGQDPYTINQTQVLYIGANGSIVGSLDEAAKFRVSDKAEEISFNMALKDKSLLGAMEVVEIHHIQKG